MTRLSLTQCCLAILSALSIALPAMARIDPPQALAPDAKNATLPDALANLGIGKSQVHASNYGVVCDGTAINTTALQTAVNATQALAFPGTSNGGGVLVLPAGFCKIDGTINITGGIIIKGAGLGVNSGAGNSGGTIIRDSRTTGDVFAVASLGAVIIRDLAIDSTSYKTSGACLSYTGTGGATYNERSVVDNVYCANAWDGIRLDSAYAFKVHNFESLNHGHAGILKINSAVVDGGEDAYSDVRLRCGSRCVHGTEANNSFTTVNTSPTVTVAHTAHGMSTGQIAVWIGATVFNNITIRGYYPVTVTGPDSFTITADTSANASGAGGGTPTYWYGNFAGFEFRAGGDIALTGSKIIGNGFGWVANMTSGPTGTVRIAANSFEEQRIAQIGVIQATAGVEYGNVLTSGNQFSSLTAQPVLSSGLYVGTGTPTTAPKWVRNITYTGNLHNDLVTNAVSMLNIQDGTGYSITGNVFDNNNTTGATVLNVGSAALSVAYSGNQIIGMTSGEFASSSMNWGAIDFGKAPGPNLAFNGGMEIDQVNEGAALAYTAGGTGYCADEWINQLSASAAQTATCARSSTNPPPGAAYSLLTTVTAAAATPAADFMRIVQPIPADVIANLGYGATTGRATFLSYKIRASITGTFGVRLANAANNRDYVQTCTIAAINTWTDCKFTIPADTTGTWTVTGQARAGQLDFILMSGSSHNGATAGAWSTGGAPITTSAQTNLTETNGATFQLANVKWEIGSAPSPFVQRNFSAELAGLQRFYAKTFPQGTAPAQSAGLAGALCTVAANATVATLGTEWRFPVEMRAAPTITTYNPSAGNANWRNVTGAADAVVSVDVAGAKGTTGVPIDEITTAPVAASKYCIHATADARL